LTKQVASADSAGHSTLDGQVVPPVVPELHRSASNSMVYVSLPPSRESEPQEECSERMHLQRPEYHAGVTAKSRHSEAHFLAMHQLTTLCSSCPEVFSSESEHP